MDYQIGLLWLWYASVSRIVYWRVVWAIRRAREIYIIVNHDLGRGIRGSFPPRDCRIFACLPARQIQSINCQALLITVKDHKEARIDYGERADLWFQSCLDVSTLLVQRTADAVRCTYEAASLPASFV